MRSCRSPAVKLKLWFPTEANGRRCIADIHLDVVDILELVGAVLAVVYVTPTGHEGVWLASHLDVEIIDGMLLLILAGVWISG